MELKYCRDCKNFIDNSSSCARKKSLVTGESELNSAYHERQGIGPNYCGINAIFFDMFT
jgi:hypothetical protein